MMPEKKITILTKDKWFFPTNTQNLSNFIAQGLITEPSGMRKYYRDILEDYPGWVPLFRKKLPAYALEKGRIENCQLSLCIVEISLEQVNGSVKALTNNYGMGADYQVIDCELGSNSIEQLDELDIEIILIPGSVPLTCIKHIHFESKDERVLYESTSKTFSNLVIDDLKSKFKYGYSKIISTIISAVDTDRISHKLIRGVELQSNTELKNENSYTKSYAVGGAIVNSFYIAKNGSLSDSFFKSLVGMQNIETQLPIDLEQVLNYLQNVTEHSHPVLGKMYTGIFDKISCNTDIKDTILDFLNSFTVDDSPDPKEKSQQRLKQISKTLTDFELNPDKSASEFFKTTKSTVEKALFMLFLRESSDGLITFNLDCLTEEDYLLYALCFGIRDGFINSPKEIKESKGLQLYVSEFMANYHHKLIHSNITFSHVKHSPPPTLKEMLKNKKFKAWFAKENNIDAVKYIFKLPKGEHQFNITTSGIEFTSYSEPKVSIEFNEDIFSHAIRSINTLDYNKYLKHYMDAKS